MIIKSLFTLIYNFIELITRPINIPDIPSDVDSTIDSMLGFIESGFDVLRYFTHWNFLLTLLAVTLLVGTAFRLQGVAMWILRKIPFLDID